MLKQILKKSWWQLTHLNVIHFLFYKLLHKLQKNNIAHFDRHILEKSNLNQYSSTSSVDIVIPIYNGFEYLQPLFESVDKNTNQKFRLIIINDFSSDIRINKFLNQYSFTSEYCEELIIRNNQTNLGFVKTINTALAYVKNHFIILNTDTEVPFGWSVKLTRPIEQNHDIASCTPWTNSGVLFSFPKWLNNNPMFLSLSVDQIDNYFSKINLNTTMIDVPAGMGFCMAFNKSIVDKIGLFDELNFRKGYGEETDWCMRAINKGYRNVFVTNLFVYHKHGGSFTSQEKYRYTQENALIVYKKHPNFLLLLYKFISTKPVAHISILIQMMIVADINNVALIISNTREPLLNSNKFNIVVKSENRITLYFLIDHNIHKLLISNFRDLLIIYKLLHIKVENICYKSNSEIVKQLHDYMTKNYYLKTEKLHN